AAGAYAVVCGWLVVRSHGLPYVLDNNESFSSLHHAYNLYHFDFWKTCGLTDEAFSPDPEAHPFLYTHQGNFPRAFAFLIFVLGARTIESQVWITTFTVPAGPGAAFLRLPLLRPGRHPVVRRHRLPGADDRLHPVRPVAGGHLPGVARLLLLRQPALRSRHRRGAPPALGGADGR